MECDHEIFVNCPDEGTIIFRPYVKFRLIQLNMTAECMNDREIDEQISLLMREVKNLQRKAKASLKKAIAKHDALIAKKLK